MEQYSHGTAPQTWWVWDSAPCSCPWMSQPVCLAAAQPRHKLCCGFWGARGGSFREQHPGMGQCSRGGQEELDGWHCGHSPQPRVCGWSQGSVRLHTCAPVTTQQWPHVGTWASAPQLHRNSKPCSTVAFCFCFQSCSILCWEARATRPRPRVRFQLFGCITKVCLEFDINSRALLPAILSCFSLAESLWRVLWSTSFLPPKQVTC